MPRWVSSHRTPSETTSAAPLAKKPKPSYHGVTSLTAFAMMGPEPRYYHFDVVSPAAGQLLDLESGQSRNMAKDILGSLPSLDELNVATWMFLERQMKLRTDTRFLGCLWSLIVQIREAGKGPIKQPLPSDCIRSTLHAPQRAVWSRTNLAGRRPEMSRARLFDRLTAQTTIKRRAKPGDVTRTHIYPQLSLRVQFNINRDTWLTHRQSISIALLHTPWHDGRAWVMAAINMNDVAYGLVVTGCTVWSPSHVAKIGDESRKRGPVILRLTNVLAEIGWRLALHVYWSGRQTRRRDQSFDPEPDFSSSDFARRLLPRKSYGCETALRDASAGLGELKDGELCGWLGLAPCIPLKLLFGGRVLQEPGPGGLLVRIITRCTHLSTYPPSSPMYTFSGHPPSPGKLPPPELWKTTACRVQRAECSVQRAGRSSQQGSSKWGSLSAPIPTLCPHVVSQSSVFRQGSLSFIHRRLHYQHINPLSFETCTSVDQISRFSSFCIPKPRKALPKSVARSNLHWVEQLPVWKPIQHPKANPVCQLPTSCRGVDKYHFLPPSCLSLLATLYHSGHLRGIGRSEQPPSRTSTYLPGIRSPAGLGSKLRRTPVFSFLKAISGCLPTNQPNIPNTHTTTTMILRGITSSANMGRGAYDTTGQHYNWGKAAMGQNVLFLSCFPRVSSVSHAGPVLMHIDYRALGIRHNAYPDRHSSAGDLPTNNTLLKTKSIRLSLLLKALVSCPVVDVTSSTPLSRGKRPTGAAFTIFTIFNIVPFLCRLAFEAGIELQKMDRIFGCKKRTDLDREYRLGFGLFLQFSGFSLVPDLLHANGCQKTGWYEAAEEIWGALRTTLPLDRTKTNSAANAQDKPTTLTLTEYQCEPSKAVTAGREKRSWVELAG
ncbi:hypothetical protein SODALDRAFT_375448 [Sodiomyces alkalinus F11]|uniref:Uncharacterized protein n=1 Tax=Sodiomyces alkalinus (strain CBS 110278 / VKM F-3762 / F11) TaxID=1314773 RepID=A0A3N2Q901_SODAK|nr:hypothetical protein SODALDRAFT_375448 [Sodiomyces alkalinus F11]ROT43244.1 hypothetical protein SODALDRAFT_375448 [Sodiomyces alkalinus F11]